MSDLIHEPDTVLLSLALTGRSDPACRPRAASAWQVLVARRADRIRTQITTWHWRGQGVSVHHDDHGDAFARAWKKAENMLDTLREPSVAAFDAALWRAVEFACMDECRRRMHREMRQGGSLDSGWAGDDAGDGSPYDRLIVEHDEERELARAAARDLLDEVDACIDRMPNDDMRVVIRRTHEGATVEEIMEERRLSRANVYQLRSRAQKLIRKEVLGDG